jgi:hypothetical protein
VADYRTIADPFALPDPKLPADASGSCGESIVPGLELRVQCADEARPNNPHSRNVPAGTMLRSCRAMPSPIVVVDQGQPIAFSFDDMMRYHGPGSPGGVAHAFKVLERALPLLGPDGPLERRAIVVHTAFGGPGARDAFELVTRAASEQRYFVDKSLRRSDRGPTLEGFVFRLGYRHRAVTLIVREGYVTDEFIALARKQGRSAAEEQDLSRMKLEMADRVMAAAAADVYDIAGAPIA